MKQWKLASYVLCAVTAIVVLSGCVIGNVAGKPHLENISQLQADEIVLVGRIELIPPLQEAEQQLNTATSERFRNRVSALFSNQQFDLDDLPMSAGSHSMLVELGKDFYIRQKRVPKLYYSGGIILTNSTASYSGYMGRNVNIDVGKINLPGALEYRIKPGDQAIYVGTIKYYRNDYNAITKMRRVNNYRSAGARFVKKFGRQIKMRRVRASRITGK